MLGFLAISTWGFIRLFQGSMLGPECAAIFVIFTAQVWNMTLSFYQRLKSLPTHMHEVATVFGLNAWQKFWRIEVAYALPALLWNMMLSMSAGWFFVVATEAISLGPNQTVLLPGIGSTIAVAIDQMDMAAIKHAIVAMLVVILLYDQCFFRPILAWTHRFNAAPEEDPPRSWLLALFSRTQLIESLAALIARGISAFTQWSWSPRRPRPPKRWGNPHAPLILGSSLTLLLVTLCVVLVV